MSLTRCRPPLTNWDLTLIETSFSSLKLYGVLNILICPDILIEKQMTSQKLTKGLNEPANMLITFMVSI